MKYLGIQFDVQNMPELDPEFIPLGPWMDAYLKGADKPVSIAVERDKGKITVRRTYIYGTEEMKDADRRFVERYVKFLLWSIGGFRVYILGASEIAQELAKEYVYFENGDGENGKRWFDVQFMSDVFENGFEIVDCKSESEFPSENDSSVSVGGHMNGCRIGFDAGGSDRKVSAVVELYVQKHGGSFLDGLRKFYNSSTYSNLEKEQTKLWHLGPVGLYEEFLENVDPRDDGRAL